METSIELETIIHALDKDMKSLCGKQWDFGRVLKDFRNELSTRFDDFIKCPDCVEKIRLMDEERNTENNGRND